MSGKPEETLMDARSGAQAAGMSGPVPHKTDATLAFMFETSRVLHPGAFALTCPQLQAGTDSRWNGLRRHFHP
jgi:homogentisate 1,2-dioxygenase